MHVEQVYRLANQISEEVLGGSVIVNEDLSNVVDLGKAILDGDKVDAYTKSLVNQVGKMVFVDRPYRGKVPSVYMDAWEFGSVVEKISMEPVDATENETWELEDGTSYDPNIFYKPNVEAKFFNSLTTFEVPISITEKQVKQSLQNGTQLNSLMSMIFNAIETSLTIKLDALIMRTINNFIGETIHDNNSNRAIKLITSYNEKFNPEVPLTMETAHLNADFIKYASFVIKLTVNRLGSASKLFNIGGKTRYTPREDLHLVLLDDFASSADVYLQSDTFHNELTKLPEFEVVPYWQGSGDAYDFEDVSSINIKTSGGNTVEQAGIIGVAFDRWALGVTNRERRTTTNYNAKAEFTNYYFKTEAGYFNDQNENFVVFLMA